MLECMRIDNIALIDRLEIPFDKGFNVLTGETGAGKSIVIDAVNLVSGGRAERSLIRYGTEKAKVEAVFSLDPAHPVFAFLREQELLDEDADETVTLSREITSAGRSSCRVNGQLVSLSILRRLSDALIDIHGQNDHQSLLDPGKQAGFLDRYAGNDFSKAYDAYSAAFHSWQGVQKQLKELSLSEQERERRVEMLQFQIRDIESANLSEGEEAMLMQKRSYLQHVEQIQNTVAMAKAGLFEGDEQSASASDTISAVRGAFRASARIHAPFDALADKMDEIYYALQDVDAELRAMEDEEEGGGDSLERIESRLHQIYQLKKKYGSDEAEILAFLEKAQEEYDVLSDSGQRIEELEKEERRTFESAAKLALSLRAVRMDAAERFQTALLGQFAELGMEKTRFSVRFGSEEMDLLPDRGELTESGADRMEFMIAPNPGQPLLPLAKIASGGEMSRVMLAIKTVSAQAEQIPCLIFDEIDTGISGRIAQAVGEKMVKLAQSCQVISVTHSSQIAALSDRHFLVEKTQQAQETHVSLTALDQKGRVRELARVNAGKQIEQIDLDQAEALLRHAEQTRSAMKK